MSEPVEGRQARFERQTRDQFEALGRFVQSFELLIFAIRAGIESRLQQESANMVHFTRFIFHHNALTAWPLWELLRGVIYTDASDLRPAIPSDVDRFDEVLTAIAREVKALINKRNIILHGTPFIGSASADQDDFSEFDILKWGVSAKGWKVQDTPRSANELIELTKQCRRVEKAVRWVSFATVAGEDREKMLQSAMKALHHEIEAPTG